MINNNINSISFGEKVPTRRILRFVASCRKDVYSISGRDFNFNINTLSTITQTHNQGLMKARELSGKVVLVEVARMLEKMLPQLQPYVERIEKLPVNKDKKQLLEEIMTKAEQQLGKNLDIYTGDITAHVNRIF